MKSHYLVTGDIGGTNSRMYLYDANGTVNVTSGEQRTPIAYKIYRNSDYFSTTKPNASEDGLSFAQQIIKRFLQYTFDNVVINDNDIDNEKEPTNKDSYRDSTVQLNKDCQIYITLAVAGIVRVDNSVILTNLGNLFIDGTAIATAYSSNTHLVSDDDDNYLLSKIIHCTIINDFVAQGYGCLTLTDDDVVHLYGEPSTIAELPIGPKVCIGAGTGLGECYLTPSPNTNTNTSSSSTNKVHYTCWPSEGGHVEYAPKTPLEYEMFSYLCEKFHKHTDPAVYARISVERVVSGTGLANVYEFLSNKYRDHTNIIDPIVHEQYMNSLPDDRGRIVAVNCHDNNLCQQSMDLMMSAYGSEVGSCAIKFIPIGGLFVTGGLTPKNIHQIIHQNYNNKHDTTTTERVDTVFMKSYLNKGRASTLLERIPCFAVMTADTLGVRGVLFVAIQNYNIISTTQ